MEAENTSLDNGSERKIVEEGCEVQPDIRISVLSEALIVEAVDLGDLLTFMVTSEDGNSIRISYFQGY